MLRRRRGVDGAGRGGLPPIAHTHPTHPSERAPALAPPAVDYALRHIERAPANQSPWAFLKGLIEPVGFGNFPQVRQACERLGQGGPPSVPAPAAGAAGEAGETGARPRCIPALALLVELLQATAQPAERERSAQLCAELATLDPVRGRYWRWRQSRACAPLANVPLSSAAATGSAGGATPAPVELS